MAVFYRRHFLRPVTGYNIFGDQDLDKTGFEELLKFGRTVLWDREVKF